MDCLKIVSVRIASIRGRYHLLSRGVKILVPPDDTRYNAASAQASMRNGILNLINPVRRTDTSHDDSLLDVEAVSKAIEHRYNSDSLSGGIYTESHDKGTNGRARVSEKF